MPWKVSDVVSERMRFILRLESGERMTDLCREFGISRKTGHKILNRYQASGAKGLEDQSRAPRTIRHRTPKELRQAIIAFKQEHPTWGPKKLKVELERQTPGVRFPACSTIGSILARAGLVNKRRRRRGIPTYPHGLRRSEAPNDVWSADFKGQFRLGNRAYCYPLTIKDHFSRYLIGCEGMEGPEGPGTRCAFDEAFRRYGLPHTIRTDNGTPFASPRSIAGLSRLSVWWLKLGILPERIEPAHPEQNGRHERFHLTLKLETARPPKANFLQQQERFDDFLEEYNNARPHEALDMKRPAEVYEPSTRAYPNSEPEPEYPLHDEERRIAASGHVYMDRHKGIFVSSVLAGEHVGLREIEDDRWILTFCRLHLGHVDLRSRRFEPFETFSFASVDR